MKILNEVGNETKYLIPVTYLKIENQSIFIRYEECELKRYLKTKQNTILLSGFPKSGNTWIRFVIFNYFNILETGTEKTLTFEMLNKIQKHKLRENSTGHFQSGFPYFWRTHSIYKNIFDDFDKVLYVYRNPMDTLISYYYWRKNRMIPFDNFIFYRRRKLFNIDYFVLYNINNWIIHYKKTKKKSDFILCYENMKKKPYNIFSKLFEKLFKDYDEEILKRSIKLSSQNNIKRMAKEKKQEYGMGPKNEFKGKHIRSGKTEQYKKELENETIKKVERRLKDWRIKL